jgi:tRNA nucleotidyltransferase (CCA-adding enzyme)
MDLEPTPSERREVERTFDSIRVRILSKASQLGLKVRVEEVGSVGKNTWIRGEADLDVFIIFPEGNPTSDVEKYGLQLGKYASKGKFIISYAEHPYTRTRVNNLDVDIVPCIGVKDPSHIVTAVDRTPFHKLFVLNRLNPKLREGILLLKRFMAVSGVYGAEIRVRGFSGYLAELLVIHYGGFREALEGVVDWEEGVLIDLEGAYANPEDARVVFGNDPLMVVDPVDRRRNVAAAVTSEKMATFVSAAREFLESPSPLFFKRYQETATATALAKTIEKKKISLIGVQVRCPKLVPDILWGQLHKSLAGMRTLLERYGFSVVYGDVWSDESKFAVFLFEVISLELPSPFLHEGPSVYMKSEVGRFLQKHLDSPKVTVGPWIRGTRWVVELEREVTRAEDLLRHKLGEARLGAEIEGAAKKKKLIELGTSVLKLAPREKNFLVFVDQFLRRRPIWLEWRSKHPLKNT